MTPKGSDLLYLAPAFHGPLPLFQHVALLFLGLQGVAEASTQALHHFPAVLQMHKIYETSDKHLTSLKPLTAE